MTNGIDLQVLHSIIGTEDFCKNYQKYLPEDNYELRAAATQVALWSNVVESILAELD